MRFYEEKDLAMCGLACVLCSNEDCPGCKARGRTQGSDCTIYQCAAQKGLDGCYACEAFPCGEKMLQGIRNRAFNRYASLHGKQALLERLRINSESDIAYHNPGGLQGDYDLPETKEAVYHLLRYGRNDPYAKCPEFDTERFHLRQVREEDAEDLLCFYGDLRGWMFYGNAWCNEVFSSPRPTVQEMRNCIRAWLDAYRNKFFIRFSIVDKATEKPIGTMELFDNMDNATCGAALHIDFSAPYETQAYITELLTLADQAFFGLFGFHYLIVRAAPDATERIAALRSAGYHSFASEAREHYYVKERL